MLRNNLLSSRIFPILFINVLGILGYSLVIPILIFIVKDFGGNGIVYGLIGASYPFFQFIGAPKLGRLSDRIGRKRVLIITQLGSFLAWTLFIIAFFMPKTVLWSGEGFVLTLPLLFLFFARILDGYTGGNISVANAYLSDISTNEDRSKNFGLIAASTSLGFVIGPALAGLLTATSLGNLLPLLMAALVAFLAVIVIQLRLEESNPCIVNTSGISMGSIRRIFQVEHKSCFREGSAEAGGGSFSKVIQVKGVKALYAVYFLTFLAFSFFYVSLPLYASESLGWSAVELGSFLAYFSLAMVVVQGPILSRLSSRVEGRYLVWIGSALLGLGFFLLSFKQLSILYLAVTVMALGNGIMWPSFMAILSKAGKPGQQGSIQGIGTSMGSLASIFGLILGGIIFETLGVQVFYISSAILFAVFLIVANTGLSSTEKDEAV